MGPSPSWTPLSNLRLMAHYPSLCTGNPTHTDQYLQWDSHYHLSAKFSVIHTLSHRAKTVCSKPELLQQEKDHLRKALTKCKYPNGLWTRWRKDSTGLPVRLLMGVNNQGTTVAQAATNEVKTKGHIGIPYTSQHASEHAQ